MYRQENNVSCILVPNAELFGQEWEPIKRFCCVFWCFESFLISDLKKKD